MYVLYVRTYVLSTGNLFLTYVYVCSTTDMLYSFALVSSTYNNSMIVVFNSHWLKAGPVTDIHASIIVSNSTLLVPLQQNVGASYQLGCGCLNTNYMYRDCLRMMHSYVRALHTHVGIPAAYICMWIHAHGGVRVLCAWLVFVHQAPTSHLRLAFVEIVESNASVPASHRHNSTVTRKIDTGDVSGLPFIHSFIGQNYTP